MKLRNVSLFIGMILFFTIIQPMNPEPPISPEQARKNHQLWGAVRMENLTQVHTELKQGADPNQALDPFDNAPVLKTAVFMLAHHRMNFGDNNQATENVRRIVIELLAYGASPFLPDDRGETTFDMLEKFKLNDERNFMVEVMHAISERYQTYSENR